MKIEHVALWVRDLELMKAFYICYFGASCGEKYVNSASGFNSYFLSFDSSARLELMQKNIIPENKNSAEDQYRGIIHIAFTLGSKDAVDELTHRLKNDGVRIAAEPRVTGDGYYESCIFDPELNRIEIVG